MQPSPNPPLAAGDVQGVIERIQQDYQQAYFVTGGQVGFATLTLLVVCFANALPEELEGAKHLLQTHCSANKQPDCSSCSHSLPMFSFYGMQALLTLLALSSCSRL